MSTRTTTSRVGKPTRATRELAAIISKHVSVARGRHAARATRELLAAARAATNGPAGDFFPLFLDLCAGNITP